MNPRPAAALALVGWYLMMPPLREHPKASALPTPDYQEPLSKWSVEDTFDTAQECKDEIKHRIQRAESVAIENEKQWAYSLQCTASDDPRLKEK